MEVRRKIERDESGQFAFDVYIYVYVCSAVCRVSFAEVVLMHVCLDYI